MNRSTNNYHNRSNLPSAFSTFISSIWADTRKTTRDLNPTAAQLFPTHRNHENASLVWCRRAGSLAAVTAASMSGLWDGTCASLQLSTGADTFGSVLASTAAKSAGTLAIAFAGAQVGEAVCGQGRRLFHGARS